MSHEFNLLLGEHVSRKASIAQSTTTAASTIAGSGHLSFSLEALSILKARVPSLGPQFKTAKEFYLFL